MLTVSRKSCKVASLGRTDTCGCGGIGRRTRFRSWRPKGHGGSTPPIRTSLKAVATRLVKIPDPKRALVLQALSESHPSMAAAARASGLDYKTFRAIATSEAAWNPNQARKGVYRAPSEHSRQTIPLESILRGEHPSYCTGHLKRRLLREEILPNKCAICPIGPEWNGLPLVLQLDHINGDSSDHRLTNLRILCPNCHSQTATFAGRMRPSNPNAFENARAVIVEALLHGATISQALRVANLPRAKCHYHAVQQLLAEVTELHECAAALNYRPRRTAKKKRTPSEYRAEQHQAWLSLQQEKLAKLRAATYDFQKFGWATQVGRLLDMPAQKVVPWIRKVDSEFLNKCKLRSIRA